MDISDIRNGIMASSLMQVQQITDPAIKDSTAKTSMEFGSIAGSGADVSKPSELLSRLEQLKNDNPEKFTDVMNDIAGLLQQASEELAETDSEEASFLSMLSSVFSSVAQTGDLSQLQPAGEKAPPPPPPADQAGGGGGVAEATTTCVFCGASVPTDSATCPMCGMLVQSENSVLSLGEQENDPFQTDAAAQAQGGAQAQARAKPNQPPFFSALAQYTSDASSGSRTSLLDDLLASQNASSDNNAMKSVGDYLAQILASDQDTAV